MALWFVNRSVAYHNRQLENTLILQVDGIFKMFERELTLKQDDVMQKFRFAEFYLSQYPIQITDEVFTAEIVNQNSQHKHSTTLKKWLHNDKDLWNSSEFVDKHKELAGGTASIFQKADSGFVRMSTNVIGNDGKPAVGSYIPYDSPVSQAILEGEPYMGRAYVVNDWYITAYKPLYHNDELAGMYYVGDMEKNIDELKKIIEGLKVGESGYVFVFDKEGRMIIHPEIKGSVLEDSAFYASIKSQKKGYTNMFTRTKQKRLLLIILPPLNFILVLPS